METMKSPCIGCEKRHIGCHTDCEGYKEWKKRYAEYKEWLKKQRRPLVKDYIGERMDERGKRRK